MYISTGKICFINNYGFHFLLTCLCIKKFYFKDYVNFSLARHSFSLKRLVEAKQAFEKLFVHRSTQLTVQQETNIKEYIFIHKVSLGCFE